MANSTFVVVAVDGSTYRARMERGRVFVECNGFAVDEGRWGDGTIVDCAADLGDDVYEALEEALTRAGATNSSTIAEAEPFG